VTTTVVVATSGAGAALAAAAGGLAVWAIAIPLHNRAACAAAIDNAVLLNCLMSLYSF
jgi:hypothetical protein